MSLLSTIIEGVSKVAQTSVRAYGHSVPQQTGRRGRARRKKKEGCTPCAAYNNAQEARERARGGQL